MNLPTIAIVGRPNVGKSTLFNAITQSRDALVADMPGITRDRQYGRVSFDEHEWIAIDTGGLADLEGVLDDLSEAQAKLAISEADVVVMVVDGRAGLMASDREVAQDLRKRDKPVVLAVNKTDGLQPEAACADFYSLGIKTVLPIAAVHHRGVNALLTELLTHLPKQPAETERVEPEGIRIAVIGQPNAGKSTLVNRMLGEERMIVHDQAGTTRDSVMVSLERRGQHYVLIDTAGIRRRARVSEKVEKFSIIKALQAIEMSEVVIYLIDASKGISQQDQHLLQYIVNAGKGLVLVMNKWDGLETETRDLLKREIDRRLGFVDFATHHFISALHGTGVGKLFASVEQCFAAANVKVSTAKVTELLQLAVRRHTPPLVKGHRIKLRYAHVGGHNPPLFIIHGNQTKAVPGSYKRYLINFFRTQLKLIGTPIRIEFKTGKNPYN